MIPQFMAVARKPGAANAGLGFGVSAGIGAASGVGRSTARSAGAASGIGTATGISGGDPDATAWQLAVVAAGGTVSLARYTLISNLITGLKADGVFPKLDALQTYANENETAGLVDIVSRVTVAKIGSPTFTADRGYLTAYAHSIDTKFNPSIGTPHYSLNSATVLFGIRTNKSPNTNVEFGSSSAAANYVSSISVKWSDGSTYWSMNDDNSDPGRTAPTNTAGIWAVARTGGGSTTGYLAGSSIGSATVASTEIPNQTFVVGGALDRFGTQNYGSDAEFTFFAAGSGFTATDVANFTTRMQTYLTAIGA